MGSTAQPDPSQAGGAQPDQGAAPGGDQASQAPANPKQQMLAQMYQLCKKMAQEDPVLSAGMQKAAQGIQEAQTAMVSQPSQQSSSANPPY